MIDGWENVQTQQGWDFYIKAIFRNLTFLIKCCDFLLDTGWNSTTKIGDKEPATLKTQKMSTSPGMYIIKSLTIFNL